METINILQVLPALGGQGGVERGTVEMAKHIVGRGAGSFVAARRGDLAEQLTLEGSVHIDLPLDKRNPVTILLNTLRLVKCIKKHGISLVHARSRAPAWSAFWASKMAGVPFVTTFHGVYGRQNAIKNYYNSVMTRGRQTIAVSEYVKQHILDHYAVDEDSITVAQRGFDPDRISHDNTCEAEVIRLRESWGVSPQSVIFICVGRITRLKGHALLFEAFAKLKTENWIAVIIGGAGKKAAYFQELKNHVAKLGLANRVEFVGEQNNISFFLAAADVAISASIQPESFGRTTVEAQAMGKPVIATAHGGAMETVQHGVTGLLVAPNEVEAMTAALENMLACSHAQRLQMGEAARRWAVENFTIEKMCEGEFSAYEKALAMDRE